MQEWLDNKNILMHSTHGEGKSVILEMFIKHYRLKSIRKMITNNNKSYLAYLNKLVDQYNNTCHHSITKIAIGFAWKIETNPKAPKFKVNVRVRITKYKKIFSKGDTGNWLREIFIVNFVLNKLNTSTKLKI